MPRLTMNFVEKQIILPESGQVIIRDDLLQGFGFGLRVTRGGMSYIAEWYPSGEPHLFRNRNPLHAMRHERNSTNTWLFTGRS